MCSRTVTYFLNVIKETCVYICNITNSNVWLGPNNYMNIVVYLLLLTIITGLISMIVIGSTKTLIVFCRTHQLVLSSVAFRWPVASIMIFQCYKIHFCKQNIVVIWFYGYEKIQLGVFSVYSFIHMPLYYGESFDKCYMHVRWFLSVHKEETCAAKVTTQFQLLSYFSPFVLKLCSK